MSRAIASALAALTVLGVSTNAQAFSTASGTVVNLTVDANVLQTGAEVVSFQVTNMPNTGCPAGGWFLFTPSDISDAQTRKNLLATLYAAKLSGNSVNVVYSNTLCDAVYGYAVPIAIIMP